MASILGELFIAAVLVPPLIWLPVRIRGVWRGEKPVPPLPIRDHFLGVKVFELTKRNFPAWGISVFLGIGVIHLGVVAKILRPMGYITLFRSHTPLFYLICLMGSGSLLFGLLTLPVHWFGRPKSLIPPAQREETIRSDEDAGVRDDGTDDSHTIGVDEDTIPDTYDVDTFATRRKICRTHLREDSLSNLRKDPRFTHHLLTTLAALDVFFAHYETTGSLEDTLPSINKDAFVALREDVFSSIRGHIIMTFENLELLNTFHDGSTTPDEEVRLLLDKETLTSLVSAHAIPDDDNLLTIDENVLFALYENVLATINDDTVSSVDEDKHATLCAFYSLRERYNDNDITDSQFEQELSQLLETETEAGRRD